MLFRELLSNFFLRKCFIVNLIFLQSHVFTYDDLNTKITNKVLISMSYEFLRVFKRSLHSILSNASDISSKSTKTTFPLSISLVVLLNMNMLNVLQQGCPKCGPRPTVS